MNTTNKRVTEYIISEDGKLASFSDISIVVLPSMRVVSFESISCEPEHDTEEMMKKWLSNHNLNVGKNGVRDFGFDCNKSRDIPIGCRIYHRYTIIPENFIADGTDNIKNFSGGRFAKLIIRDPFSCDFPSGWSYILRALFKNDIQNRLGCRSENDCYSLFSCEDTPCLEELYTEDDVQYMALFLPIV